MGRYSNEVKKDGFAVRDTRSGEFMPDTFGFSYKDSERRFLRIRNLQSLPTHLEVVPVRFVEAV